MTTMFNDPIHGVMLFQHKKPKEYKELAQLFKKLIAHQYFQRLRRIKQLGTSELVFPGAVHTRFNHSIGVCYLANRIGDKLALQFEEKKLLMVSALLHDIGHGPLSHVFEGIYHKGMHLKHDNHWLKPFFNELPMDGLDLIKIESIISSDDEKRRDDAKFLKSIISSNLDADRLDYLLRDSHFCGVPYGGIDLDWIISSFKMIPHNGKPILAINRKGLGALEDFLCARRLMTRNIYFHKKIKAAEFYVTYFIKKFFQVVNDEHRLSRLKESDLFNFLKIVESLIFGNSDQTKDLKQIANDSFPHYSKLTDDDIWLAIREVANSDMPDDNDCKSIAKCLIERALPHCYEINPSRIDYCREIISKYKHLEWKLHIDTLDMISYKPQKSPIYIADEEGNGFSDANHESNLLNFLSDKKEHTYFLYIAKDINDKAIKDIESKLSKAYCFYSPLNFKLKG